MREHADHPRLGLLARPGSYGPGEVARWPVWAADNGQFSTTENPVPLPMWRAWLRRLDPAGCLFAVVPDRPFDWPGTLARWPQLREEVAGYGFVPALAAQDGATAASVPWLEVGVLFLGGSTSWKEGPAAHRLTLDAIDRGVPVHMGRVNTRRRLQLAAAWGCSTVDGTLLGFGARANLPLLLRWLDELDALQLALPPG